ncbi:unnamed protein product [Acanthoscelides obtectus]|uniref:Uncharacterized protein n=1 Tax=Acanthoscelides obtectus TaxID=200917 RepID=A0A9P0MAU1_ACAOB|nr:unnamed protein product [Acanthoscelides obtectus]CAK1624681.1 hypothetical protein AOBTE_LOCUS2694 [Acanthoscelides obtectus]
MEILYLKTKGLERTQNMISVPQRLMKNAQFSLHLRPYSFMLEYGSISIIKGWLIRAKERRRPYSFMLEYESMSIIKRWLVRAKERSKKSGTVVIKSYIHLDYKNMCILMFIKKIDQLNNLAWLRKEIQATNLETKFKSLRKEVDKTIRDERISYYHSIISKSSNKQKTTWNIVNSIKGKQKNAVITELVCDNVTITNPTDIANFFGKYVSTVIGKKMAKNFTVLSDSCTTGETAKQSMFFTHVTTDDVILICDK